LITKFKKKDLELGSILNKTFVKKNIEDDQELECEMHQTKYKEMIGFNMD
jgi:hypothetical protein